MSMKELISQWIIISALGAVRIAFANTKPILQCKFDDGLCDGWENEEEHLFRWVVKKGPAKDTGPKYDYTRQDQQGGYLYFDDNQPTSGRAIIRTPPMDLRKSNWHCLRFVYFARGTSPGEVRIFHSNRGEFGRQISLFAKSGPQSKNDSHWIFEDVSVSNFYSKSTFDKVYFRIQALKGRRENNVVAIDDFSVTRGRCPKVQFRRTVTTVPPMVVSVATNDGGDTQSQGRGQAEVPLTAEQIAERNAEIQRENEERNRKLEEMNARINSGQTATPDPSQQTQAHGDKSEAERQRLVEEEQRKAQAEANKKLREEAERLARENQARQAAADAERKRIEQAEAERLARLEAERKAREALERQAEEDRRRKEQEEAQRLAKEEADRLARNAAEQKALAETRRKELQERQRKEQEQRARSNRERQEQQRLERLRLRQQEEARRKLEMDKRKEQLAQIARETAERERKLKELQEAKHRAELDKQKRRREEELRRHQERENRDKQGKQNSQDQNTGSNNKQVKRTNRNPNLEKCGSRVAHKVRQICCQGQVRKRFNEFTACCGKRNFNSKSSFCCDGSLYSIKTDGGCCGNATYDPKTHGCCNEQSFLLSSHECFNDVIRLIAE